MLSIKAQARSWASKIAPKTWVWKDTYSLGGISHLNLLLNEVISKPLPSNTPLYGFQFIFNTQANTQLGSDGYDNYQAPVDEKNNELYKRRMWVGGSFEFIQGPPKAGDVISCHEQIRSVRCLGPNAFVNISREFTKAEAVVMKETRMLLYTNEPYRSVSLSPGSETKTYAHSAKLTFSLSQLMRFNALSYNLHKIHYDAEYCREEHLKTVIVSGPFLVSTMLRFFTASYPNMAIRNFTYKNSEPCYIDEEVELGITETEEGYTIEIVKDGRLRCGGIVTL